MTDTPRTADVFRDAGQYTDKLAFIREEFENMERELAIERRWVHVTEALPAFDLYVLTAHDGKVFTAHRSKHGGGGWAWRVFAGSTFKQEFFTHWRHIPNPPA